MRNLIVTGVTLNRGLLAWTTLRPGKGAFEIIDSGHIECGLLLQPDTPVDALATELKGALASVKGLVCVGIPSDQLLMKVMTLPTSDIAEITSMVQLQMDKISPFPEDKMAITFERLAQGTDSTTVLIGAIRAEIVDLNGAAFKSLGLDVDRLDLNPMVWWKLLGRSGDLYAQGRRMAIVPDGRGCLAIAAQSGEALAFRALASADGLSHEEYANELADDLAGFLLSLELEHGDMPLAGIEIWGDPSLKDPVLPDRLAKALRCPVVNRNVELLPDITVGLGERALADFNPEPRRGEAVSIVADLVPAPWRQVRAVRRMRRQLLVASAALALLWLLAMGLVFGMLHWQRGVTRNFEESVATLEKDAAEVKELRTRINGLELNLDRSRSALECLREVSLAMPQGISLVSLQYRKGGSIVVRGETLSVNLVYDLKDALDKSRLFKGVNLGPIQPNQRQHATVQVFQLSANVPGAEQ